MIPLSSAYFLKSIESALFNRNEIVILSPPLS
nr:MAG TPA: hypothetical protein [Caudoviricetes sp.]DAM32793.1 MAG TPA: hypothetical protein [Caudoviricetes sp.]